MYSVDFVRQRVLESKTWTNGFCVDSNVTDPQEAFRKAVREFLSTPAGKKIAEGKTSFTWGDAMKYVPEDIWNSYGLYTFPLKEKPAIYVQQDENLMKEH